MKDHNGFKSTEHGSTFICENCGKRTRVVCEDQKDTQKCLHCLVLSYTENEHLNPDPNAAVKHVGNNCDIVNCPACKAYYYEQIVYYRHSGAGK